MLERTAKRLRRGWTSGAWSRNRAGEQVSLGHPAATCWCMTAALRIESNAPTVALWHRALRACYLSVANTARFTARAQTPGARELDLQVWQDADGRDAAEVIREVENAAATIR